MLYWLASVGVLYVKTEEHVVVVVAVAVVVLVVVVVVYVWCS